MNRDVRHDRRRAGSVEDESSLKDEIERHVDSIVLGYARAMAIRYVHTNLVARDWERLEAFYRDVFGCVRVGHVRDLSGDGIDAGLAVSGGRIRGVHLRLPGFGDDGPTLEIFRYEPAVDGPLPSPRRPGWGHIAFQVDDVDAVRAATLAAGGGAVGEIVRIRSGPSDVTWCYVTDPEGNAIELQRWG